MNMTSIWGAGKNGFSGVWPIIWTHQVQAASAQEFVTRFRKRWDKTPENQAVNDYLAIKILAEAMAKNKSTEVDKVIAFLEGENKFDRSDERRVGQECVSTYRSRV